MPFEENSPLWIRITVILKRKILFCWHCYGQSYTLTLLRTGKERVGASDIAGRDELGGALEDGWGIRFIINLLTFADAWSVFAYVAAWVEGSLMSEALWCVAVRRLFILQGTKFDWKKWKLLFTSRYDPYISFTFATSM